MLNANKKYATLIFDSFAFWERYWLNRNKLRKFRPLEMVDKRFPPLDHGGVASAFFTFFIFKMCILNFWSYSICLYQTVK